MTVRCIEKDIAEMAALNNFTYNQIATCSFIQEGLQNVHQKKASCHKSVAKHVSNYAKLREQLTTNFENMKAEGQSFS